MALFDRNLHVALNDDDDDDDDDDDNTILKDAFRII